jgi:Holliday junction resolvasome RuvABC ATP-dependent DNA helicase subunit
LAITPTQRTVTTSGSMRTVLRVTDRGDGVPDIVFVGGAPGVGKTSVARPLAARLGMDLTHVDDFCIVLERMTDPERYPAVHEWRLHPERVLALDDVQMVEHTRSVSEVIGEAIPPVIADRLEIAQAPAPRAATSRTKRRISPSRRSRKSARAARARTRGPEERKAHTPSTLCQ